MAWLRFSLPYTTPAADLELYSIPGVRATGTTLRVHDNAGALVERILGRHNLSWTVRPYSPDGPPLAAIDSLVGRGLREWVPAFLTSYQRAGVLRMAGRSGHFWWAAGAGKSLGGICWALASPGATLVVTKAGVRRQWVREIGRFTTCRARLVEEAKDASPEALRDDESDFLVCGWEMMPDIVENVIRWWKPTNWIADEIHATKNPRRWTAVPKADGTVGFEPKDNIAHAVWRISRSTKFRLGMTATPVKDRVRDLWAQLDLVHPDAWGRFYAEDRASFTVRYCAARRSPMGFIENDGASNLEELAERVKVVADNVPHSVTHRELPAKRRVVTFVRPADQNPPAGGFAAMLRAAAKSGRGALLEAKLMEAASRKRKALMGALDDAVAADWKTVVFTGRREDCDRLAREIGDRFGTRAQVWSGHGGDSLAGRDEVVQAYMTAPGPCVLVGTGDAFGTGLNLHDSDLLLVAMLPYTPGQVVQWEGRVARLGQKRPVMVQYLVAEGTVDEHVADILVGKLPAVEKVTCDDAIDGMEDQLSGFDNKEALIDSIFEKMAAHGAAQPAGVTP